MSDTEQNGGGIDNPIQVTSPRQTTDEVTPPATPETVQNPAPVSENVPPTPPIETPTPQPATPTAPLEPDYREKFSASTRRNQVVESQFKELQRTLGDLTNDEVPTDDEMKVLITEWELLNEREQYTERKMLVLERRQNKVFATVNAIATQTETLSKLEDFVSNEPRLKGKENEFFKFATDKKNAGANPEVLLGAFLFENTPVSETPVPPVEEPAPPSLERGSPSGNMPPVPTGRTEYSPEELKVLRTTDPRKYNEMIRKGQI